MSCEVQVPKPKLVPSLGLSEPYTTLLFSAVRLVKQTRRANEAIASESAEINIISTVTVKMRKIQFAVILLFCAFIPPCEPKLVDNCGIKFDDITKAISQSDTPTNFAPWVVSIGIGEDIKEIYKPLCTGTIIKGINSI